MQAETTLKVEQVENGMKTLHKDYCISRYVSDTVIPIIFIINFHKNTCLPIICIQEQYNTFFVLMQGKGCKGCIILLKFAD